MPFDAGLWSGRRRALLPPDSVRIAYSVKWSPLPAPSDIADVSRQPRMT
jgi:hypothetical protein